MQLNLRIATIVLCSLVTASMMLPINAQSAKPNIDVAKQIASAKSGATTRLPAGTFKAGNLRVPTGAKIVGSGFGKTIIDASDAADGIVVSGRGNVISDLTITGAKRSALQIKNASDVTVSRVQVMNSLTGLIADGVQNGRIENLIAAGNRTGVVLSGNRKTALINSTLVSNAALGLSLAGLRDCAVFNNLIANSPTGVYVGGTNQNLALDFNHYIASFIGKQEGEVARKTVQSWRDVSGQDAHSVSLPVTFADDTYRPISPLTWSPNRATTSDWGASELAGFKAPAQDILGGKRTGAIDVGAYEVALPTARPADGRFKVLSSDGVKSAGIYTKDGTNIAYLFQNLPLRAGTYDYWLPARDAHGRNIAAGDYELRVAQSQLELEYVGLAFNCGKTSRPEDHSSYTAQRIAFDNKDRIIMAQGWSENHLNVRAFDASLDEARWTLPGSSNTHGVAVDGNYFFALRQYDKDLMGLVKLDTETGQIQELAGGKYSLTYPGIFTNATSGMAALNGVLFVADPSQNKLFYTPANKPTFETSFSVAAPSSPSADTRNNLIWLISRGQKVHALAADGTQKHELTAVVQPLAIAINNNLMAIASGATGKIHFFDISNPAQPREVRTLGRGDSPYNPFHPDRFLFKQEKIGVEGISNPSPRLQLALNSAGELAVLDEFRVLLFDANGQIKRDHISVWGQHMPNGKFVGDETPRFFSIRGDYAITLDPKSRTWKPDGFYYLPGPLTQVGRSPVGYFNAAGKNFGIYRSPVNIFEDDTTVFGTYTGPKKLVRRATRLVVVRFDGYVGKMVEAFYDDGKVLLHQVDDNNDGLLDEKDAPQPLLDAEGKTLPPQTLGDSRFANTLPDGSLRISLAVDPAVGAYVVPMRGLNEKGNPIYEWANRKLLKMEGEKDATFTSPYDFKTTERLNGFVADLDFFRDGGYAATVSLRTSGGTGLANNFGTDVAGFSPDGKMQWLHPLSWTNGVGGIQMANDVVLTNRGTEMEFVAISRDGLGLGVLGPKAEARWGGWWVDHPEQFRTFTGSDGKPHVLVGDYVLNAFHWFVLNGTDKVRVTKTTISIDGPTAERLAALEMQTPAKPVQPPTSKVTVHKLKTPLVIDGDLTKWRKAGVLPQVLVTPEAASADIKGPQDKSAVIRLAHEGGNLYAQVLAFDDVVTMHQPLKTHYKQDSVEMAINSFMAGFKFNVTRTQEHGETIFRDRFVATKFDLLLDPSTAPRVIKVLDNAKDVEERSLIESIYGVDLSNSKVIVTEFKLPLEYAFSGDSNTGPKGKSGETFWIGFMIDDNDVPGSDLQKLMVWPATYGTFAMKEAGALATFE